MEYVYDNFKCLYIAVNSVDSTVKTLYIVRPRKPLSFTCAPSLRRCIITIDKQSGIICK